MKTKNYKLSFKGHVLQCDYGNNPPQFFRELKKELYCEHCKEHHSLDSFMDIIDIDIMQVKEVYANAVQKYSDGLQLKRFDAILNNIKEINVNTN